MYIVYPLNFLILGFFENAFEKAKFRSHFLILGKSGQLLKQIDLEAFPSGVQVRVLEHLSIDTLVSGILRYRTRRVVYV